MPEADLARINAEIMERVNSMGRAYLSHTKVNGTYMLRLAIGNIRTNQSHVEAAWADLRTAAAAVMALP
jgi:aromatic-L-amino-acid decarboxylase